MFYKNKKLLIDNLEVDKIIKQFGTPLYCYSYDQLKINISKFKGYFNKVNPLICFAVKANNNLRILSEIARLGLGADVVSKGELMVALKSKIQPKKIVFSGVGKTSDEIEYAAKKNILLINAESQSEINVISKVAKKINRKINIGIRLNPNVDAKTIKEITTGKYSNKFGLIEKEVIKLINQYKFSKYLRIKCLSAHIGSQITSHIPYLKMLKSIQKIIDQTKFKFEYIDLGGGMGINYGQNKQKLDYKKYSKQIEKFVKKNNVKIIFEPGRSIIGNTGYLFTKIIYIKKTDKINFVILNTGMNDLMRPALYGAFHRTLPVIKSNKVSNKTNEFVGPICESTDKFITLKKFQKLEEKDLIAICDVGAYGMSLSSNYNLRPKPIELLIKGSKINVIRKRQKHSDII